MVLYNNRAFFRSKREYYAAFIRNIFLQSLQSYPNGYGVYQGRKHPKEKDSVSAVSAPGRSLAGTDLNMAGDRLRASFTVEAAMVLGIVFLALAAVIKEAYILHDTVTGSMILEETMEKAAYNCDIEKDETYLISYGEKRGNPRLWLGTYEIGLNIEERKVNGRAAAGDWNMQMEIKRFRPETFLRRAEALKEMGNGQADDGSGV